MEEPIVPAPLVERLREVLARTIKGNWQTDMDADDNFVVYVDSAPDSASVVVTTDWGTDDDVEFIALAHNAMPALLDALTLIDTIEQKSKDACRIYSGEGSVLFEHKDILAAIEKWRRESE